MGEPIKSITIVGGGTSGWLAAAFLSRAMETEVAAGRLKITLIESPKIPIIGVGEATSPALRAMFQYIGLNESEFIRGANVAFKLSGFFHGWNVDVNGQPISWVNPFLASAGIAGRSPGYYYNAYGRQSGESFSRLISSGQALIEQFKGPRPIGARDYEATVPYAYHFDASEVAKYLSANAKSRGVEHILDDVVSVNLDDRQFVSSLTLERNGEHPIDLVIDSTGFAGVIINKALGEPFEPFDRYLPNDRAAVMQIPHEEPLQIEPVTRAVAMKHGWRFIVALYNRIGTGYVYSSQYTSDEEAMAELKAHIGDRANKLDPRVIRMRIGKSRRSWVNNCIAIGLSSGFVEPLEATAIHSVDLALRWLYAHFPDSDYAPALQASYNGMIDEFYDEVIDFIVLHYHLNNRTDTPFWRDAREEREIPDSLAANLFLWRYKMPSPADLKSAHFFNVSNYLTALMGKGYYDEEAPVLPGISPAEWEQYQNARRANIQRLSSILPGHVELLDSIRKTEGALRSAAGQSLPGATNFTFNLGN